MVVNKHCDDTFVTFVTLDFCHLRIVDVVSSVCVIISLDAMALHLVHIYAKVQVLVLLIELVIPY